MRGLPTTTKKDEIIHKDSRNKLSPFQDMTSYALQMQENDYMRDLTNLLISVLVIITSHLIKKKRCITSSSISKDVSIIVNENNKQAQNKLIIRVTSKVQYLPKVIV